MRTSQKEETMSVQRKGYSKASAIPAEILAQLNQGAIETATIAECFAMDFKVLLSHTKELAALSHLVFNPKDGVTKRMAFVAEAIYTTYGLSKLDALAKHPADTVRGWAAYLIGHCPKWTLAERLHHISSLADDSHFGVREWAWLGVRPKLALEVHQAIELLTPWTQAPSPYLRRFAVESLRPVGVWAKGLQEFKADPSLGLPLLEPLKADASRYVQDSVANWLNDAGKTQPAWVKALCKEWQQNPSEHTQRIIQRALRNLKA
jgi:3-methyladenine DNA glycosylase AlkC